MTVKVEAVDDTQNPIALKASYTLTKEGQTKDEIGFLNTYNKPSDSNTNKKDPITSKEDPTTVVKDTTNNSSSSTPKTGDDTNIMMYLFTMMTSLASILLIKKRLSNH